MKEKYQNFWKAAQCALGFVILFTGFVSPQNLQSKIMEENGFGKLGNYNLACVSIFCIMGGFASTTLIKRLGCNICLIIGALGDAQWILCSVLPAMRSAEPDPYKKDHDVIYSYGFIYSIMIISSCVCGFTTGVLWTAQGVYNSQCATEDTKGFYFSFFWTCYMLSQVFGNLISALVLGNSDQVNYFFIMAGVTTSSCFLFATLRKPVKILNSEEKQALTNTVNTLEEKSLSRSPNDPQQRAENAQQQQTLMQNIKSIWNCLIQKRMLLFLPENGWTGISISYYSGMLIPIITATIALQDSNPQYQFKMALFAMVVFGLGQTMGGLIIGQVVDKINSKVACLVIVGMVTCTIIVTYAYLIVFEYFWLVYLMTFMWGLQDSAINTHVFEMLGFEFDNSDDPFAIYSLIQSLLSFFFQFAQALVDTRSKYLIYTGIVGVMGILSNGCTYFFEFREKKIKH